MSWTSIDLIATGNKIRELRTARGLTVKDVQAYLNLSEPQSIYKWQRGECLPSVDHLHSLAKLFGVRIDDILIEKGGPPNDRS